MTQRVVVYRFTQYQIDSDKEPESTRYATLAAIERARCAPIKDSLRTVDAAYIDVGGFYVGPPLDS